MPTTPPDAPKRIAVESAVEDRTLTRRSANSMIKTPRSKTQSYAKAQADENFSLVPREKLLAIYAALLKCSMLEQRVAALFQQGKLESSINPGSAHEASAAAITVELEAADAISIMQGDWLPAFVKGLSLDAVIRSLAPAAAQSRGLQPLSPVEARAKNILLASDATQQAELVDESARALRDARTGNAVAAFLSPRSELTIEWRKLITSAASGRLPIVFVLQLDQGSQRHVAQNTPKRSNPEALLNGVPAIAVDATDPVALYRVAYEAITRARQGRGATVLDCIPGPDPADESKEASSGRQSPLAPVTTMETYLKTKGIEAESHNRHTVAEFNRDLDLATRFLDT
jgi:TPP-dependent pyruvate/acetoin dehydrogenase alpha subunit